MPCVELEMNFSSSQNQIDFHLDLSVRLNQHMHHSRFLRAFSHIIIMSKQKVKKKTLHVKYQ
jgi:hypothetical protein